MPARFPNLLSIAGSDPSGGAGVQADLKTFSALRCYGMAAVTALTAQNTRGVASVHPLAPKIVAAQIVSIFADVEVDAVKIGMLAQPDIAHTVADALMRAKAQNVILDPVLAATSGDALSGAGLVEAINAISPLAALITPNLSEAAALTGAPLAQNVKEMEAQARALVLQGARAALVTGGHLEGEPVDVLYDGGQVRLFHGRRIETRNTHGTGCALSSAIAARLAHGATLVDAIAQAKSWLEAALDASHELNVGSGRGPPHHFHALWREK
jgi:hydroxymethylpyrimidine/phosphomethylpyrimidine kinase